MGKKCESNSTVVVSSREELEKQYKKTLKETMRDLKIWGMLYPEISESSGSPKTKTKKKKK